MQDVSPDILTRYKSPHDRFGHARVPTDLESQGIEVGQGKSGIFFVGQGNV